MPEHPTATREEWQAARDELLTLEKEHTRRGDELARMRRELPWVRVEKEYRLDTDEGPKTLPELFDGRSQLLVYHFMFGPSYQAGCPTCSSMADGLDGLLPHLHARDVTMLFVSRAPLEKLQAYKRRMGWRMPWASSANSDFNFDFGASYTEEQVRSFLGGEPPPILQHMAESTGTDVPGYVSEGTGIQRLPPRRRRGLSHLLDSSPRPRVPDGLLPDPRPRAEGTRRGRHVPALDPAPRRVSRGGAVIATTLHPSRRTELRLVAVPLAVAAAA
jgi:predicted dithiol-disulfide oxidoreductase (DUF899 family)